MIVSRIIIGGICFTFSPIAICQILELQEGMVFNSPEIVWNAEPNGIGMRVVLWKFTLISLSL